jgi:hypothetical protein
MNNKIFALSRRETQAPNTNTLYSWEVSDPIRYFQIKSVYFGYSIVGAKWPDELHCQLQFGNTELNFDHFDESKFNVPLLVGHNGKRIYFYQPGQWFFYNWYVSQTIPIYVEVTNNDALIAYQVKFDVLIETDIKGWTT